MITPAVLLSACASLIIATTSRLNRAVDRSRELLGRLRDLRSQVDDTGELGEEAHLVFRLLDYSTTRSRLLQRGLAGLYYSVGAYVATSVAIAFAALTATTFVVAISLGITGSGLLLYASLLMVRESRVALAALRAEMDYVWAEGRAHAPAELLGASRKRNRFRMGRPSWSFMTAR